MTEKRNEDYVNLVTSCSLQSSVVRDMVASIRLQHVLTV